MPRPAPVSRKRRPAARGRASPKVVRSDGRERLQKVLAAAGLGSRRQCEELITTGRVEVDHRVVTELGTRVDPASQIRVDGVALHGQVGILRGHKPSGVVCTNSDPAGRPRVVDLVPVHNTRLFTIGRLDLHSEGLILVTNDGELANRLTHPRYGVAKTYRVTVAVARRPRRSQNWNAASIWPRALLGLNIWKSNRTTGNPRSWKWCCRRQEPRDSPRLGPGRAQSLAAGRMAVGPVRLGTLPTGEVRRLTAEEVKALRREGQGAGDAHD